jgi:hypothetical protein
MSVKKLIIILGLLLASTAKADPYFETGPAFLLWEGLTAEFTNGQAYLITQPLKNNYEVGVIAITSQVYSYYGYTCSKKLLCYSIIPQNYAARLSKTFEYDKWEFGAGLSYWKDKSIIFPQKQTFELTLGYKVSDRTEFRFRHYSNADQSYPNIGLNTITIDHRF